jgi:hypothetical protein
MVHQYKYYVAGHYSSPCLYLKTPFLFTFQHTTFRRLDCVSVLPEDGDRIRSPKRCVLKNNQDGVLDQDKTMDNVQEHNICYNYMVLKHYFGVLL